MNLANTKLFSDGWNVCYRAKGTGSILSDKNTPFIVIKNNFKSWVADPFLIEHNGETYIFGEIYSYVSRRGLLGYAKLTPKGNIKWKKVIREKHHLSYPYIFKSNDSFFIIPESSDNSELCVYKAIDFPNKWEKVKLLKTNEKIVDTTFFECDQKTYALTYDISNAKDYKLKLIEFQGQEQIILDKYESNILRPGGCFFEKDGEIYRPAQICERRYGEALVFYKCKLQVPDYEEEPVQKIYPSDLAYNKRLNNIIGLHTYNSTASYEVIDIQLRKFNLIDLISKTINLIKIRFSKKK